MRSYITRTAAMASVLFVAGCAVRDNGSIEVTGQIEAVSVGAGSRVGGRVAERLVDEGDVVHGGDVMIRLDTEEAQAAVAAAEARLAQAESMLAKLEAGARPEEIRQAEAAAAAAEEQYLMAKKGFRSQEVEGAAAAAGAARAQRDEARAFYTRIKGLRDAEATSQQQYDQALHAYEAAEAQYRAARQKESLAAEGFRLEEVESAKARFDQAAAALDLLRNGARKEDIDAARAARDAAAADLARSKVLLDEMTVKAPRDGVVQSVDVYPGDIVKAGSIVQVVDPEDLKLMVYVSAAMLGFLQTGQKIAITTDSHGSEPFEATITFIASEGEFTPRNLQTREERAQQVFGVKLEMNSSGGKLRAGMAATAHFPKPPGMK